MPGTVCYNSLAFTKSLKESVEVYIRRVTFSTHFFTGSKGRVVPERARRKDITGIQTND